MHSKIIDGFLDRFTAALAALRFGMPWEEDVGITPLPEPGKPEYLGGLVQDALSCGAEVVNEAGGEIQKTFFYPAVVFPVDPKARLYHEEQFGPVIPVCAFDDPAEPVAHITESEYGQQVSLFGQDPKTMGRLIDPLVNQVCRINLNSQCQRGPDTFPFTGRKGSAEGTLSVSDALRVFSIRTLVAAKMQPRNEELVRRIVRDRHSTFLSTDFIF